MVVVVGFEAAASVAQGYADVAQNYDARFTEQATTTYESTAQGQIRYFDVLYDVDGTCDAESFDGVTQNVAGTATVRHGVIRLLFDRLSSGAAGWAWHGGQAHWQDIG